MLLWLSAHNDVILIVFQLGLILLMYSYSSCTLIIDEVSEHYVSNHGEMYILLLDASQAFDRVNYVKLFRTPKERGVCPLICRFLALPYTQ
jgi:hypothetical protein